MSYHNNKYKINLVLAMKNRIKKICHQQFLHKNLNILYNIFIKNSYPPLLLKKLIFNNNDFSSNDIVNNYNNNNNNNTFIMTEKSYFSIPYVKDLSYKIRNIFKNIPQIVITDKVSSTLNKSLFSKLKDKIDTKNKSNVIYKIDCNNCNGTYIGQTKRLLSTRIKEHKLSCAKLKTNTALSEHHVDTGHFFKFNDIKILDTETHLHKRLFLEMVNIYQNKNCLNKKTDIQNLTCIYTYLLKKDSEKRRRD